MAFRFFKLPGETPLDHVSSRSRNSSGEFLPVYPRDTGFSVAQIFSLPPQKLSVLRLISRSPGTECNLPNPWQDARSHKKRPRLGKNSASVQIENIGEIAVIECDVLPVHDSFMAQAT
jgi:hypothetical protein